MYNKLPKWLTVECPDYVKKFTEEQRENKLKEHPCALFWDIFCTHRNKVPNARTNDIYTFKTFNQCLMDIKKDKSLGLGVGIFGPLCGVDIDHCIDENGVIAQTAQDILDLFAGQGYAEVSFSGTGIHILFFCKEQHDYKKYYVNMQESALLKKGITDIGGLEFYQGTKTDKYLTLTGNAIYSNDIDYTVTGKKIKTLLDTYFTRDEPEVKKVATTIVNDDKEDLAWARFWYKNNESLRELYNSIAPSTSGSGEDESKLDLKLLSLIAYGANNNINIMRYVFEHSNYCRTKDAKHQRKWFDRRDYSVNTINEALSSTVIKNDLSSFKYEDNIIKGGETMKLYQEKENQYSYRDGDIRYHVRLEISKSGKLYAKWIQAYDCVKKESLGNERGYLDRNIKQDDGSYKANNEYYKVESTVINSLKD